MSGGEELRVLQVGSPPAGADLFYDAMAREDLPFKLEAIATTNPDLRRKKLGDVRRDAPAGVADTPFISIMDAVDHSDAPVIISHLEDKLVDRYEARLGAGRLLVVGASTLRERPDAPVVSVFANGNHIDELYEGDAESGVLDGASSLASLVAVPLAPLQREIGIESLGLTSLQGWSDAGMSQVPALVDQTRTDTHPIDEGRQAKVRADLLRMLGGSIDSPADIEFSSVKLQHGPWVRGHYAKIVARLAGEVGVKEIEHLWRDFEAPEAVKRFRPELKALSRLGRVKWPTRHQRITPIKFEYGTLMRHDNGGRPVQNGHRRPMRVGAHLLEIGEDHRTLTFEIAGDNLIQGLVGGALANVLYARAQGYLS